MSTLEEIRNSFSIESHLTPCLEALRDWAKQNLPGREDEIVILLNRYNALLTGINNFLFTEEEAAAKSAQVVKNALDLMRKYEKEVQQKAEPDPGTVANANLLHDNHKYTCNRATQHNSFDQWKKQSPRDKPLFYYLYGDELHVHKGFFRRLAFEMEGGLLVLENEDLKVPNQVYTREITIKKKPDLDSYKTEIVGRVFKAFELLPDAHAPLLEKDITYVMTNSPVLNQQRLTADDYICIYTRIHQLHWDPKLTPMATRWFIRDFCKLPLPPDAPQLIFFLGLEYDELMPGIQDQVLKMVEASDIVHGLPKLEKVSNTDIQDWLLSYEEILELSVSERRQLIRDKFPKPEFYMDELIPLFEELIHQVNNQNL
ncbi:MAG: hypothetical protein KDC44_12625 [Phaeodactylibacter sp.]|nr:hypothetical protein [Phaeodactylibacter sp.]